MPLKLNITNKLLDLFFFVIIYIIFFIAFKTFESKNKIILDIIIKSFLAQPI